MSNSKYTNTNKFAKTTIHKNFTVKYFAFM